MALTGKQKAAMLLMSLDAATAAEMVKGLDAEIARELAVELTYLDVADVKSSGKSNNIVRQFHHSLKVTETFQLNGFLDEVLKSTVGQEKAEQIVVHIQQVLCNPDPFITISSVDPQTLALVLAHEHPETIAVVLSGLSTEKMIEVLNFLDGGTRVSVVGRMNSCRKMTAEAKAIIAEAVCERLEAMADGSAAKLLPPWSKQSLRKVAVIVRDFGKEIRDGLLSAIGSKDNRAGEMIAELMIIWADILHVTDRSIQKVLRGFDAKKLALALHGADKTIIQKIKSNLSKQTVAVLDEQASLISAPGNEDIEDARGQIVRILREMNEKSENVFMVNGCMYDEIKANVPGDG
ncbi:FliG C-terminal domain-containing protein [Planctomycetota bacterium]